MKMTYPNQIEGTELIVNNLGEEKLNNFILDIFPTELDMDDLLEEIYYEGEQSELLLLSYNAADLDFSFEMVIGAAVLDYELNLMFNLVENTTNTILDTVKICTLNDLFFDKPENILSTFYRLVSETYIEYKDLDFSFKDEPHKLTEEEKNDLITELNKTAERLEKGGY